MFPRLPARAAFVAETKGVSDFRGRNKCLPVCTAWKHNIHFVSRVFTRPRNIMSNNVSATMSSFARPLDHIRHEALHSALDKCLRFPLALMKF